ncbi:hypothetical protein LTR96_004311 [Exophiala xenobiotica]|nr:hypothetical protein LTR92_004228 [Exophiala xenobiotica]KAK5271033.1 hypothetical protein LTR96_004311 [Exophiala xenobiotica]KAK5339924.1 hypothetical protein LTR98_004726 [Exophiala xenobiotica]KAK5364360.1 hypothetical protein LTS13_008974 [Exophiala xenobiotica]KAK5399071.1 hypothetical protein LTR79_004069 [Exophiala xenobiotica]
MPEECARRNVSPAIVATRRKVIRESLKDGLRAWVEGRALQAQKRKADEMEAVEKNTVKTLVRRFAAKKLALERAEKINSARWGREIEMARHEEERRVMANGACPQPTRAHVLGLKKFWEGVIRAAG